MRCRCAPAAPVRLQRRSRLRRRAGIAAFGTETVTDFKTYSKEQILDQLGKLAGKKPTYEEAQAVQTLQNLANTPGEIIKLETINSSERNQALKAVDYI